MYIEDEGLPPLDRYHLEIVDRVGKEVWRADYALIRGGTSSVFMPALSGGTYFVRLYDASRTLLREFAVKRAVPTDLRCHIARWRKSDWKSLSFRCDALQWSRGTMTESLSPVAVLAALAVFPSWGHHSAAAEYDASRLLVLTGTVTKVEWTNPHVYFHLDVKSSSGRVVNWRLEMASPNGMLRQHWLPYTMKPGALVTVEAYVAKDYDAAAKVHRVKVPDGRWLFADSSGPSDP